MTKIDTEALLAIPDSKERYAASMKAFREAKIEAGKEIEQRLTSAGRGSLMRAAQVAGCDEGGFGRRLRSGGFTVPPDGLVRLSYQVLNQSCHRTYFGVRGVSELPVDLTYYLHILQELTDIERKRFLAYIQELNAADQDEPTRVDHMSSADIIRMRIKEASEDRYVMPENLCGEDAVSTLKTSIRKITTSDNPQSFMRIQTLMFMAMELNTSLDYFIAPDYLTFTDVRCYGKGPEKKPLRPVLVQILGIYLKMSQNARNDFAENLLQYGCRHSPVLPSLLRKYR